MSSNSADYEEDSPGSSPARPEHLPVVTLAPYRGEPADEVVGPGIWLQEVHTLDKFLGGDHVANGQYTFAGQQIYKDASSVNIIVYWGGINKQVDMPSRNDYQTMEMISMATAMSFTQRLPMEYASHWTYGGAGEEGLTWILKCTNFKNTRIEKYDPFGPMNNSQPIDDIIYEECGSSYGNGIIYMMGGVDKSSDFGHEFAVEQCRSYDVNKRQYNWIKPMTLARRFPGTLYLSNRMVMVAGGWFAKSIAGGFDRQQVTRSTEFYDCGKMKWTNGPNMLNERYSFAAVEWRGKIVVMGGRGPSYIMEDCESLDRNWVDREGTWVPFASLNVKRYGHSAVVLDGHIYVLGGMNPRGSVLEVEKYNEKKEEFEIIGKLVIPRFGGVCGVLTAKYTQRKRTVSKISE